MTFLKTYPSKYKEMIWHKVVHTYIEDKVLIKVAI